MALSAKSRNALLNRVLPSTEECQSRVRDYMARTGLSQTAFAHRIGYSPVSFSMWQRGNYNNVASHDRMMIARCVDFMDAHPIVADDDLEGDIHETRNFKLLRDDFFLALDRARIVVRHGNPGTQKSFVARYLIAQLNRMDAAKNGHGRRAYYVYAPEGTSPSRLMKRIAIACGVAGGVSVDSTISNLRHDFTGRRALLIIDEAQHLTEACLETIRELNDMQPHFGLLLMGSHDLKEKFAGFRMEQWRSRLHILDTLPGISRDEARGIVAKELPKMSAANTEKFLDLATVSDDGCLVKEAHVRHLDKAANLKEAVRYISARELFWNIRETKNAAEARKVVA